MAEPKTQRTIGCAGAALAACALLTCGVVRYVAECAPPARHSHPSFTPSAPPSAATERPKERCRVRGEGGRHIAQLFDRVEDMERYEAESPNGKLWVLDDLDKNGRRRRIVYDGTACKLAPRAAAFPRDRIEIIEGPENGHTGFSPRIEWE